MKICSCEFPDGLLYDMENFVWVKVEDEAQDETGNGNKSNVITLGITSILASMAGTFIRVKLKDIGTDVIKDKSVGSVESNRYFNTVKSPINGKILQINNKLMDKPKLANNSPYEDGWFLKLQTTESLNKFDSLKPIQDCRDQMSKMIEKLHVRCFSAFPDYEMLQIGIECAATLSQLGELVSTIDTGNVVHVVSDDTSAEFEMVRWSDETGHKLLETRREGNLYHFIIKKS